MDNIVDSPPARCQSGSSIEHDLGDGRLTIWPAAFDGPDADALVRRAAELGRVAAGNAVDPWRAPHSAAARGLVRRARRGLHVLRHATPAVAVDTGARARTRSCEPTLRLRIQSVLANRYRSGQDAMGWHADDEPELGEEPVIASLSLGATRRFRLRHRARRHDIHAFDLPHGSLLVMSGAIQRCWMHCLARTKPARGRTYQPDIPPGADRATATC